jgi:hypothetical protein
MIFIKIHLFTMASKLKGVEFEDLNTLSNRIFSLSFDELNKKYNCNTWCFIPRMLIITEPYPEVIIDMEVYDYFNYPELEDDVTRTFPKHWENEIDEM